MIEEILKQLKDNLNKIIKEMGVTEDLDIFFDVPKDSSFGDYSTNISMRLTKILKKNPILIANEIKSKLDLTKNHLEKCEVAGQGFLNFFLDKKYLMQVVFQILQEKENYGSSNYGQNKKINIEFVSANPTGYLHIGHCRGAAYGDSLARIYQKVGYNVSREHYVNDGGNQIHHLTNSIYARYQELFGIEITLDKEAYHGKEIIEIAKNIKDEVNDKYLHEEWYDYFCNYGVNYLLNGLKKDLKDFNVTFDTWFSEKSLYDSGAVKKTLEFLKEKGYTYEKDNALWLKTTIYGDEKDRVLVKSDGTLTYFTPDIAYHANKLSRGFAHLIDVLGADHHGYISRLKAAIAYVGGDPDLIDVEILQMVRVIQNGEEIKMSKRSGKAITMRDLIDEVGTDALRFMFVSKSLSTHMDLDLDLAVKQSNENPVYYVQYAYARIASLFRNLKQPFKQVNSFKHIDINKFNRIILTLLQYPQVIIEAATKRIPHKVCQYALNLASVFHSYYNDEKIITDNEEEVNEKLTILKAVQIVIQDALKLLGVGVKEEM